MAFSGNAPRRDVFSLFTKAGEYDYTCPMHFMANYGEKEGMIGTIIVKNGHKANYLNFSKPRVSADSKAASFSRSRF